MSTEDRPLTEDDDLSEEVAVVTEAVRGTGEEHKGGSIGAEGGGDGLCGG